MSRRQPVAASRPSPARGLAAAADRGLLAATICGLLAATLVLAACGGTTGSTPDESARATSTAAATPVPTYTSGGVPAGARRALHDYFAAVAAQDAQAAAAVLTPTSPLRDDPLMHIRALRDLTVEPVLATATPPGTSALVQVGAWLAAEGETAWGPPGRHDFFTALTRQPDGSWLVDHMATSP